MIFEKNKMKTMWIYKIVTLAIFCLVTSLDFCRAQTELEGESFDAKIPKSTQLSYDTPQSVGIDSIFLHQKIDSIAQEAIAAKAFPGMQVLIAKSGKVVFHKAYGFHTYDNKKNVQLTDLYDLASVSKITTALPALMKLHGEGKFKLDEPFKTYFPKFKKSNKSDLTYREILAHQAGLKPWIPYWTTTIKRNGKYKWRTLKNKQTKNYNIKITDNLFLHKKYKKRIYKAIYKSPVSEVKEYKYSGLAFYLFPEIVADLTKMDFETYLKKEIYEPIGASTLTYNPERFFPKERIIPTERDTFFRKIQIHGTVHDEGAIMMGGVSANAGLFGTATDLVKLMQLYLNGGSYGDRQIIAQASIDEFTKYQFPENNNRRGLGFDKPLLEYDSVKSSVAKDASPASYGHSGYTGTFVWVDPEYELIYIFFSNRVFPTRNNRKIYEMNVRPNIQQVIYDSIKK
jgi:beta-N-acetylhexosaminidase